MMALSKLEFQTIIQFLMLKYNGWNNERLFQALDFIDKKYLDFALKLYVEMEDFK